MTGRRFQGGLSMNKLSPRKIAAIVAAVGLLGLAAVALKKARRPALVVIENEETDSSYQDGSIHGGDCLSCETDVEGPVAGSVTPELDDDLIVIHVAGAVARPEVYSLPHGSRVADAVRAAGGATSEADLDMVNLALPVHDGEQICIPRKEPTPSGSSEARIPSNRADISALSPKETLININTASVAELEQLPGVGPVTAAKIVEYRKINGPYSSVNDLLGVSGIGEAKLSKIAPHATVR